MNELVTLIIILHNRHENLDRLLIYYNSFSSPVIIADSSAEVHSFKDSSVSYKYLYTPGVSFTKKIEMALAEVKTPYIVMCADDDFIIPEGILQSVDFLEKNKDYTVAQGICINYKKSIKNIGNVEFGRMYVNHAVDISSDDPFMRLETLFNSYRSILYAVHRTDTLRLAFKNAGAIIKNLYLNEYLTAIVPMLCGKSRELPMLYQVREYSEVSDDKTTDNLDIIFIDKKYAAELNGFIQLAVNNVSTLININKESLRKKIYQVIEKFSSDPVVLNKQNVSFKKKIGLMVKNIPLLGAWLIEKNRRIEKETEMKNIIKTEEDARRFLEIKQFLQSH